MFAISLDSPDVSTLGAAALFIFAAIVAWRTWANRSSSSTEGSGLIAKVEGVAAGLVDEIGKLRDGLAAEPPPPSPAPPVDPRLDRFAKIVEIDLIYRDLGVPPEDRAARFVGDLALIVDPPPPEVKQ